MVRLEFKTFIIKLCAFYERKKPDDGTMDLWFDSVAMINQAELQQLFNQITQNCETFPRNITATMRALHNDSISELRNPETVTYKPCSDCNGDGHLFLEKHNPRSDSYLRYVFRCDKCKQSSNPYPWGNKWVLLNRGYKEIQDTVGTEKISNIKELREFLDGLYDLPF
jgi:hypothetical protein